MLIGRGAPDRTRLRVGLARKWEPQRTASFEERRSVEDARLADIAEIANYYDARCVIDQHLAPQVESRLRRLGVRVEALVLTAQSKTLVFAELRARIHAGTIELPDDADLLADLRGLRSQFRAGASGVVTPRTARGHSDLAVAACLACWGQRSAVHADSFAQYQWLGASTDADLYYGPALADGDRYRGFF